MKKLKKINFNLETLEDFVEIDNKFWQVKKIIISLTVTLSIISCLFNTKVTLCFFIILVYEVILSAASLNLFNNQPMVNKIADLCVGFAISTILAVLIIKGV